MIPTMAPGITVLESGLFPLTPHHPSEIIVGIVLMLIIFFVMWKTVVPAFEKLYAQRHEQIEGGIRRAAEAEAAAEAMLAKYQQKMAAAREEAAAIREEAKSASEQLLATAREEAEREKARILASGQQQLAAEREHLVAELKGDIGGLATTLAGKIVGESLADDQRANRAVDRFLAELEMAG